MGAGGWVFPFITMFRTVCSLQPHASTVAKQTNKQTD